MNNYYINPLILYGIELLRNFNTICVFGFILGCFVTGYTYVSYIDEINDGEVFGFSEQRKQSIRTYKKALKNSLIISVVCAVICVVVPSEKAMYRMLIASYFTKENTQEALETIDMATNKLIDKIIKAREKK